MRQKCHQQLIGLHRTNAAECKITESSLPSKEGHSRTEQFLAVERKARRQANLDTARLPAAGVEQRFKERATGIALVVYLRTTALVGRVPLGEGAAGTPSYRLKATSCVTSPESTLQHGRG